MSAKRPATFGEPSKRPAKRFKPSKARAQLSVRTPAVVRGPTLAGAGSAAIARDVRPLPGGLDVEAFIKARAHEVSTLQEAMRMAASRLTTRAFQSLPRHLRRRAASHNARRVPTRLRDKARIEIDSKDKTVKMQKKKARLKHKVTVTDVYRYRQKNKTWLETHIWHAKRMHMFDTWGYRLARTPTRKSRRPAFRAARHACVVNDLSYFATVEVSGTRDDIVAMLKRCLGITPWAGGKYESGARRADTTIHAEGAWPAGLIGPVEVIWRASAEKQRQVWLRMHPAMFNEAWDAVRASLVAIAQTSPTAKEGANASAVVGSSLEVRDLRGSINAFEVIGPQAGSVIHSISKLSRGRAEERATLWDSLGHQQSSAALSAGLILGVDLQDPRLRFPPRRERLDLDKSSEYQLQKGQDIASSRLWDANIRDRLLKPHFTKAELDARRHQSGEPGKRLHSGPKDDSVPIMLIQQTHKGPHSDCGVHGYTLLHPAGWSMALWQSLVFTGAQIGGVDERRIQHAEVAKPSFPDIYPTTRAGEDWWDDKAEADIRRWRKRPPAKRLSMLGLGVQQAWKPDWRLCRTRQHVNVGTDSEGGLLAGSVPWLLPPDVLPPHQTDSFSAARRVISLRQRLGLTPTQGGSLSLIMSACIIQVSLEATGRGKLAGNAAIFLDPEADKVPSTAPVVAAESQPVGFVLFGGISMLRGHGFGMGGLSYTTYLEQETTQDTTRQEGIRVLFRNRGEPCAWRAIARVAT